MTQMKLGIKNSYVLFLSFIQLGVNAAIISIIPLHLKDKDGYSCLLSNQGGFRECNYGYVTAGVGIVLNIVVMSLTCHHVSIINSIKGLLLCIASGWYACASGILTLNALDANNQNIPGEDWRTAIYSLCWANVGLTLIMATIHSFWKQNKIVDKDQNYEIA